MEKTAMQDADYAALAKAMRKVDLFAPLTLGELEEVVKYIMLFRYAAGETVFKQGGPGDAFYIVYDGEVSIRVKSFAFLSKTVRRLGAGDVFGEMALLDGAPRNASVVCEAPTRLFVLLSADFAFVLKKNPSFAQEMRRIAERRRFMSR
ncbi:MAG: cyclic nucleotide-binding domain-containing protein [Elusimicrobia bacterium]|nr:cyclic nucleotide-binding domain-containing protein [Elusimicrobiota bacterium]